MQETNEARRKLLKAANVAGGIIATGIALPEIWVKPVVESVLLPAHAQTSNGDGGMTVVDPPNP